MAGFVWNSMSETFPSASVRSEPNRGSRCRRFALAATKRCEERKKKLLHFLLSTAQLSFSAFYANGPFGPSSNRSSKWLRMESGSACQSFARMTSTFQPKSRSSFGFINSRSSGSRSS